MTDSKGVIKNIDILTSEIVPEDYPSDEVRAEEDCDSDSDTLSNIDARQMFSNRSIKDLSFGNFKHFKLLNSEAQLTGRF